MASFRQWPMHGMSMVHPGEARLPVAAIQTPQPFITSHITCFVGEKNYIDEVEIHVYSRL